MQRGCCRQRRHCRRPHRGPGGPRHGPFRRAAGRRCRLVRGPVIRHSGASTLMRGAVAAIDTDAPVVGAEVDAATPVNLPLVAVAFVTVAAALAGLADAARGVSVTSVVVARPCPPLPQKVAAAVLVMIDRGARAPARRSPSRPSSALSFACVAMRGVRQRTRTGSCSSAPSTGPLTSSAPAPSPKDAPQAILKTSQEVPVIERLLRLPSTPSGPSRETRA